MHAYIYLNQMMKSDAANTFDISCGGGGSSSSLSAIAVYVSATYGYSNENVATTTDVV